MGSVSNPEIILYTNHGCPWAHRAHVILHELGVSYKEEIIDLSVPRTPEYLKINPRGLVPTISYNGEIITESLIVSQFLADAIPSHLLKKSDEEGGALQRARINFFVDTYFTKVNSLFYPLMKAEQGEEKNEAADKYVAAVVKEIEPLLQDAGPYFGGAEKFTLAEVLTASFILRIIDFAGTEELIPGSILKSLESKAPKFYYWANEVVKQKSVTYIWDKEAMIKRTKTRIASMK